MNHDGGQDLSDETIEGGKAGVPGRAAGNGRSGSSRARRAASGKLNEAADRVRDLGDRARDRHRVLGYTRPLAYQAAEGIEDAAEYLRSRDFGEMKADLETQVRRHPLAAIAVAFLAGYTLRRIF